MAIIGKKNRHTIELQAIDLTILSKLTNISSNKKATVEGSFNVIDRNCLEGRGIDKKILSYIPYHNQIIIYRSRFAVRTMPCCAEKAVKRNTTELSPCNQIADYLDGARIQNRCKRDAVGGSAPIKDDASYLTNIFSISLRISKQIKAMPNKVGMIPLGIPKGLNDRYCRQVVEFLL